MDLLRVGIMPSPERITKAGADYVSDPHKYLEFYRNMKKVIMILLNELKTLEK